MATGTTERARRLRSVLGRASGPERWADVQRRLETWRWPAFQMAVAGAVAYLVAGLVNASAADAAPITAMVAIGFGRERRLERSAWLITGVAFGVVTAEIASAWLGGDWWAIGLVVGISALVTGVLFDAELAVVYAAFNAAVLLAIPGSEGWVPANAIGGAIGAAVGVAVLLVLLPPSPDRQLRRRLEQLATNVEEAASEAVAALSDGLADHEWVAGDDRATIAAARRLDDEIERSHATADHARQMARWSPLRRVRPGDQSYLRDVVHDLRPALRTISTIVRLSDRMLLHGVRPDRRTIESIEDVGAITASTLHHLVARDDVASDVGDRTQRVVDRLGEFTPVHGAEIAVHEELRGILNDLRGIVGRHGASDFPGPDQFARDAGGIRLGPT